MIRRHVTRLLVVSAYRVWEATPGAGLRQLGRRYPGKLPQKPIPAANLFRWNHRLRARLRYSFLQRNGGRDLAGLQKYNRFLEPILDEMKAANPAQAGQIDRELDLTYRVNPRAADLQVKTAK
jgi:hypothetical protein